MRDKVPGSDGGCLYYDEGDEGIGKEGVFETGEVRLYGGSLLKAVNANGLFF